MFNCGSIVVSLMIVLGLLPWTVGATPQVAQQQDSLTVARSVFTTSVVEREPADNLDTLFTDVAKVFYFTELRHLNGKTIRHRWIYNGEEKAVISFEVKGNRWRVNSSKNLLPEWVGEWTVEVLDEAGAKLKEDSFVYRKAPATVATVPPAASSDSSTSSQSKMQTARQPEQGRSANIPRTIFTTSIVDREPADKVDSLYTDVKKIYFFTEIRNMAGKTIKHRWRQGEQVRAEVEFNIAGDRWRVHSSKNLITEWVGVWTAEVVGEDGAVLASRNFSYLSKE